jgi:hypothetical protein
VPGAASPAPAAKPSRAAATYRLPWADLLEKVFAVDVLAYPACGGRLQVIAFIAQALAPPELFDPGPSYDTADPA